MIIRLFFEIIRSNALVFNGITIRAAPIIILTQHTLTQLTNIINHINEC